MTPIVRVPRRHRLFHVGTGRMAVLNALFRDEERRQAHAAHRRHRRHAPTRNSAASSKQCLAGHQARHLCAPVGPRRRGMKRRLRN